MKLSNLFKKEDEDSENDLSWSKFDWACLFLLSAIIFLILVKYNSAITIGPFLLKANPTEIINQIATNNNNGLTIVALIAVLVFQIFTNFILSCFFSVQLFLLFKEPITLLEIVDDTVSYVRTKICQDFKYILKDIMISLLMITIIFIIMIFSKIII